MNIFAILTFDYVGHLIDGVTMDRADATISIINRLDHCLLSFRGISFKPGKMLVEVWLDTDPLDAPRHEGEAAESVQREIDKAELDCSILIVHGTDYIDEQKPYRPQMTIETQLRTGEA